MEEQYGLDCSFISEVPDYLKCIICHLVLRNPIQVMECGHRFCKQCLERIKGYSQHLDAELCCPIDRETINLDKVFQDNGIGRVIGDLQVRCVNNEMGCIWSGDLRDNKNHEEKCDHQVKKCDTALLKRVSKCEDSMVEKEKDLTLLKYNLHELKKSFGDKEEEVDSLKIKNIETEKEINLVKEQSQELKRHFEREIEVLTVKNQLLQKNVDSFENQLLELKNLFIEGKMEVTSIKTQVDDVNNNLTENLAVELNKPTIINSTVNDEVKKLKEEVMEAKNEIRATMSNVDKSLNKYAGEINELSARITTAEEAIEYNFNILNDKINKETVGINLIKDWKKDIGKAMNNIVNLEYHVTNMENVLFCDLSNGSKDIVLQWKLQNYQYHFDIGKDVYSPIFFTQVKGYCFKLCIGWNGEEKENLGLFLYVCRGSNYEKDLETFNMQYSLEMLNNSGFKLSEKITIADMEADKVNNFILQPGQNESRLGYGIPKFLTKPKLKTYIVNDMLSIQCRLTP